MNTKTDRTTALTQSMNKLDYLLVFALFPLLLLLYLLHIYQPTGVYWQLTWVPSLDLNLSFSLDALSFLFASLITGIGFLIQIYAWDYLREHPARLSFHIYLTLFMLAMLGLVCSDNIFLMFIFWELTTLTSYFLIGFNHSQAQSRRNALQSLVITGAGGLVLLAVYTLDSGQRVFLDVAITLGLVAFLGTVVFARLIAKRESEERE